MELDFNPPPVKRKMIMVRFTEDEYAEVKKIAGRYQASLGETTRVLVRAALRNIVTKGSKTSSKTKK